MSKFWIISKENSCPTTRRELSIAYLDMDIKPPRTREYTFITVTSIKKKKL